MPAQKTAARSRTQIRSSTHTQAHTLIVAAEDDFCLSRICCVESMDVVCGWIQLIEQPHRVAAPRRLASESPVALP